MKVRSFFSVFAVFVALFLSLHSSQVLAAEDVCWKTSYGRNVGLVPDSCVAGREKDGALCYNKCPAGMSGSGPVCWTTCPAGTVDSGAFCSRSATGSCPANMFNDGVASCWKSSQVRDAGIPMICGAGKVGDAGLCYEQCKAGFSGVGPVCWGSCSAGAAPYGVECGALCAVSANECAKATTAIVMASLEMVGSIVSTIATGGAAAAIKTAAGTAAKLAAKGISKEIAKAAIREAAKAASKNYTEMQLENMALASVGADFDPADLDPTGIASLVQAMNKPICGEPGKTTANTPSRLIVPQALQSVSMDYLAPTGGRETANVRFKLGKLDGFDLRVGNTGGASRIIRYVSNDNRKWVARVPDGLEMQSLGLPPNTFIHQPEADYDKAFLNDPMATPRKAAPAPNGAKPAAGPAPLVNAHTDDYMIYKSWDGNFYRGSVNPVTNKWQITKL